METVIIVIASSAGTVGTLIVWAWISDFISHYRWLMKQVDQRRD